MANAKTSKRSEQRAISKTVGKPFQKGKSGNPGGRPRIPDDVKEAAKALTSLAMKTLEEICRDAEAPPSARVTAAEAILNRAWGKPVQAVTGEGGGSVQIIIRRLGDE